MTNAAQAWRCTVCGYVHRGPEPPGSCPVCGVPREEFEAYADPAAPAAKPAARRWFCDICGFVHEGPEPPEQCPVCGADRGAFEPREEAPPAAPPPAGDAPRRLVVVGAGAAGVAAVEAARRVAPGAEIVLLAREPSLPYYRINLTRYLAGEVRREDLPLHPEGWYADQWIDLRRGADVAGIDPAKRTVALRGGTELPFDRLVLACGAHPFIPPLDGARLAGVFALRTVEDADAILAAARPGARVLCVGGGILGLETAGALARRKADVTVLESHASLMPRQLDPRGGARLAAHLATLGVRVRYGVRAKAVAGTDRATGLRIATGETLPADAIVLATGVRTESWLARQAGLTVKQGVVVNDRLQTSHPEIFAAGDAAEHQGLLYGNWFVAQAQGAVAGANAAGGSAAFGGVPRAHTLKVLGLDTVSIGQFVPADGSYRAVADETEKAYRGFVFRDGVLVGANLVGDASLAGAVRGAIESRRDFSGILAKEPSAADVAAYLAGKA
jgi:nitrite reductase (NADH) large subunit